MFPDKPGKLIVGFGFLGPEDFLHSTCPAGFRFHFPIYQTGIYISPVLETAGRIDLNAQLAELGLVDGGGFFCDQPFSIYIFLSKEV